MHEKIPLDSIGLRFATVDKKDYKSLVKYDWFFHNGYACRRETVGGKKNVILMHRQILGTPDGMDTDHKDMDGLNNARNNIRICTRSQNVHNSPKRNMKTKSKYKGVSYDYHGGQVNKLWRARVGLNYKRVSVGYFKTEEEAARAYDEASKRIIGEFAQTNF